MYLHCQNIWSPIPECRVQVYIVLNSWIKNRKEQLPVLETYKSLERQRPPHCYLARYPQVLKQNLNKSDTKHIQQ